MKSLQDISNVVKKYVHNECTGEELDFAMELFEEPYRNMALRPELYKIWNNEEIDAENAPSKEDFNQILNHVHHQINLKHKKHKASRFIKIFVATSKIAAILILGLVFGLLVHRLAHTEQKFITSIVPTGAISQVVLPDNSIAYLNAGTELKYLINGDNKNREVYLKGEAWFDVSKDKNRKFIVHTQFYDVNVLGTQFNVKAYPEDDMIATTLEEGRIQIKSTDNFKIQNNQFLLPGEQLIYNKVENKVELKKVNTRMYTAWKDNKLIFIDMSLKDLIVLLERKYGVEIEVDDASLLDLHYDGTLRNESIIEVMKILQETLPVHYEINEQKIVITNTNLKSSAAYGKKLK